jgi:phosphatidylglycerophosphate synthase
MRKISKDIENPIDNLIIDICEKITPFFRKFDFTPNMITTISLLLGVMSGRFMLDQKYKIASFCFMIAYLFDCLDGFFARKYDMETVFGDFYDHFSDMSKTILVVYLMHKARPELFTRVNILILLGLFALMVTHLGCQEQHHNGTKSPTLAIFKPMCPNKNNIEYTKWFGVGTFITVLSIAIFSLSYI